jgi:hypothetical protein
MKRLLLVTMFFFTCTVFSCLPFEKSFAYDACSNTTPAVPCTHTFTDYPYESTDMYLSIGNSYKIVYYNTSTTTIIHDSFMEGYNEVNSPTAKAYVVGFGRATGTFVDYNDSGFYWIGAFSISLSSQASGGVEGDGILCGVDNNTICQLDFDLNSEVELEAYPNNGYAFAYWDNGTAQFIDNPHTFIMDGNMTVTAKFARSLKWPLSGYKEDRTILSGFSEDWLDYCNGQITKHTGIDIDATTTDVVYAAETGIVRAAQTDQEWGGWVTLEHSESFTTVYWHIIPSVSVDDNVTKDDPIGMITNYGGPIHLHFGLREGAYTNTSNRGKLPQSICGGDPVFPEKFVDPETLFFE